MIGFVLHAIGAVPAPWNDVPSAAGPDHGVLCALLEMSPVSFFSIEPELKIIALAVVEVTGRVTWRQGCRGA